MIEAAWRALVFCACLAGVFVLLLCTYCCYTVATLLLGHAVAAVALASAAFVCLFALVGLVRKR